MNETYQLIGEQIGIQNIQLIEHLKMSSNEQQVKKLHEKLNMLESVNPENNNKVKLTHIQQIVNRISEDSLQESELGTIKAKEFIDVLKKIEVRIKEQAEEAERLEQQSKIKIQRVQKIYQRAIQRMTKERKDTQKKINVALQGFLIQLTSAKMKSSSAAKYVIKQFANIELQLNSLESQIEAQENSTKDITKKIYTQFSSQIQELSEMILEQKRERQIEQQKVITRIQKLYMKVHESIRQSNRQRDQNEQEVVNFLEKIIEKIRYELLNK